jgi:membrane-bound lytic murein transglycosylase D
VKVISFYKELSVMKKMLLVLSGVIILALVLFIFYFSSGKKNSSTESKSEFQKNYRVFAVDIPEKLDFAGEPVPIDRFDVRESIDKELTGNTFFQSQTSMYIKRANRWFPVIEPILKKNNIPDDFKYLAVAESGFENLVSPANAVGFWQLLKETAISYGLVVTEEIDERYSPEKSTEAACKYIRESYNTYKSWTEAAASYNMGKAGLNKQIESQKNTSYYDLLLNTETSRYVYRILAFKIILSDPKSYGYYFKKRDLYPEIPSYTVAVDSSITDIAGFAKKMKVTYKMLKWFNPWLRKNTLTNPLKKVYNLKLPKEGFINYSTLLKDIPDENLLPKDSVK